MSTIGPPAKLADKLVVNPQKAVFILCRIIALDILQYSYFLHSPERESHLRSRTGFDHFGVARRRQNDMFTSPKLNRLNRANSSIVVQCIKCLLDPTNQPA
jgi:hypothetical protein